MVNNVLFCSFILLVLATLVLIVVATPVLVGIGRDLKKLDADTAEMTKQRELDRKLYDKMLANIDCHIGKLLNNVNEETQDWTALFETVSEK